MYRIIMLTLLTVAFFSGCGSSGENTAQDHVPAEWEKDGSPGGGLEMPPMPQAPQES